MDRSSRISNSDILFELDIHEDRMIRFIPKIRNELKRNPDKDPEELVSSYIQDCYWDDIGGEGA